MILIVESGSTKADWCIIRSSGKAEIFQTKGWNPLHLTFDDMNQMLNSYSQLQNLHDDFVQVHFYSPGVVVEESIVLLNAVFTNHFNNAEIYIESDMLAAARAVYNSKPLFVSILGTGSNTAFYDGCEIEQTTPSLGFILGDEGSGAALGKDLLKAYLYKQMPRDVYENFSRTYSVSKELVLKSIYKQKFPNRFLASYVPFLVENKEHLFVKELVRKQIQLYIDNHLKTIPNGTDYPIVFVGSIGYFFQNSIKELLKKNGFLEPCFTRSPIHGLVEYHTNRKLF